MDLFDVARSCVRRWYVFLPLLLLAAWFSYGKYTAVQPVYYSQAVIGFAGPSARVEYAEAGVPVARNGLIDVGGASLLANMTALGLREPAVVDTVVAGGGLSDYSSKMFPTPTGVGTIPLVMVEETNPDPEATLRTLELVMSQSAETVKNLQRQAGVAQDQMATALVVMPPTTPSAAMPSRTRSTVATFVAGAGLTVLLTVLVDVLLTRLLARRRRSSNTSPVPPQAAEPNGGRRSQNGQPAPANPSEETLEPR